MLHPDGKWRRECQPGTYMSYLYGLRFMQSTKPSPSTARRRDSSRPSEPALRHGAGDYDIVTHNDLLGLQIGADMTFRKCRWAWGVQAKAGPYINFSNQDSTIDADKSDGPSLPSVDERLVGDRYTAALIGEVGFQATYKFRPNLVGRAARTSCGFRASPWRPNNSSSLRTRPTHQHQRHHFSQGVSLGLEWMW